jgi:DNA-binding transcriptional LysR family regulator
MLINAEYEKPSIDRLSTFLDLEISPKIVTEASDFTAVLAQVAGGNAATIAPVSVAETFLDLKSTVQLDLTHPVMTHSVGSVN